MVVAAAWCGARVFQNGGQIPPQRSYHAAALFLKFVFARDGTRLLRSTSSRRAALKEREGETGIIE